MPPKRTVGVKTSEVAPADVRRSKRPRNENEPRTADILFVQHCLGPQECVEHGLTADLASTTQVVKLTPGQKQVVDLRRQVDSHVLMFVANGYKYRLYGRDSHTAARRLGICCIPSEPFEYSSVPMGRVAYHSARLVGMGYVVCIVDQESAALKQEEGKKGLFERSIRPFISRGTMMEPPTVSIVDEDSEEEGDVVPTTDGGELVDFSAMGDRFMLFLYETALNSANETLQSITLVSFVTGTVFSLVTTISPESSREELKDVIMVSNPVEIISMDTTKITEQTLTTLLQLNEGPTRTGVEDSKSVTHVRVTGFEWGPAAETDYNTKLNFCPSYRLALQYLSKFGLAATVGVLPHLHISALTTAITSPCHTTGTGANMFVSGTTLRQLDVLSTTTPSGSQQARGSLLWLLHRCSTAMGYRLLRNWLSNPMADRATISGRHDVVDWLKDNVTAFPIQSALNLNHSNASSSSVRDFEATVTRLAGEKATPLEYIQLLSSLQTVVEKSMGRTSVVLSVLSSETTPQALSNLLLRIANKPLLDELGSVKSSLMTLEEPKGQDPWNLFISPNFDATAPCLKQEGPCFDRLRDLLSERTHTVELLEETRKGFEKKLGFAVSYKTVLTSTFLLEVDKTVEKRVPQSWTVHSRIKVATRYTSPETLELVGSLTATEEKIRRTGEEAWKKHQRDVWSLANATTLSVSVRNCASALAELDVLTSFSSLAQDERFCRPEILPLGSKHLELNGLRHPVLMMDGNYVANDVLLRTDLNPSDGSEQEGHCWVLTGPNMGGKSALMRSVALTVLLAHIGCYVPCERSARIPTFTAIRSRLGAEDAILQGHSTFLTEMSETAAVLKAKDLSTSLVLMDEVGRGTSSFDGIAVASAVLENLSLSKTMALFVTHYPEICVPYLQQTSAKVSCKFMNFVKDDGDDDRKKITFLYQVVDGVTPSSFGMNVALAAGLSPECIAVADEASQKMENSVKINQMRRDILDFLSRQQI